VGRCRDAGRHGRAHPPRPGTQRAVHGRGRGPLPGRQCGTRPTGRHRPGHAHRGVKRGDRRGDRLGGAHRPPSGPAAVRPGQHATFAGFGPARGALPARAR